MIDQHDIDPEWFYVAIHVKPEIEEKLTPEQKERLALCLDIAARGTKKISANMLKGVVKYPTHPKDPEYWRKLGLDDLTDALNYKLLEDHCLSLQKKSLDK